MSTDTTMRRRRGDPRKPEYWQEPIFGAAVEQDSELLANVAQWRYVRSEIDAVFNNPDNSRDEVLGLYDRLEGIQERLAKAMPLSCRGRRITWKSRRRRSWPSISTPKPPMAT